MNTLIARTGLVLSLLLSACTRLESEVVSFKGRDIEVVDAGDGPC